MRPQTVICWRWPARANYRSSFGPETVNVLRRMVLRHYGDIRFVCVTNDSAGLDPGVEVVADRMDFADVPSPHGGKNPSCYRRLRAFAPDAAASFGDRFVSLDLDTVITGDLRPLWERDEDFVVWGDTNPRTPFNCSMFLLTAGARPKVWNDFDPKKSPLLAMNAGFFGSDQGWISFCLKPNESKWGRKDGVYSYRNHLEQTGARLPENARIVFWHGRVDPWSQEAQALDWVREHWK